MLPGRHGRSRASADGHACTAGVTENGGQFSLLNVRVGGPYTVKVTLAGFREQVQQRRHRAPRRGAGARLQAAAGDGHRNGVGDGERERSVQPDARRARRRTSSQAQIEALPTIARRLDDFARTNPFFNQQQVGNDGSALSVAGRNNRYNNIQIDGAVNNDLFGLAASGAPGGQADAQPVSLDAIQEIQLAGLALRRAPGRLLGRRRQRHHQERREPVLRHGLLLRPQRVARRRRPGRPADRDLRRQAVRRQRRRAHRQATRRSSSATSTTGGARRRPACRPTAAPARTSAVTAEVAAVPRHPAAPATTTTRAGIEEFIRRTRRTTSSSSAATSTSRPATSSSSATTTSTRSTTSASPSSATLVIFPDGFYQFKSKTNSTVAQLNSNFGRAVNELRVTYQRIRDRRGGQDDFNGFFPCVQVNVSPDGTIRAGREHFSTANALDQDVIELTDDFTLIRGKHTFTFGTHNEFFKFRNLFIRDNFGSYRFASLDLFEQGLAQQFDYSFSRRPPTRSRRRGSGVNQFGFYAGDLWRVSPSSRSPTARGSTSRRSPTSPTAQPGRARSSSAIAPTKCRQACSSRRASASTGTRATATRQQIRGGIGLFSGRTPYVWLSQPVRQHRHRVPRVERRRSTPPTASRSLPDPNAQPTSVGQRRPPTRSTSIDPDYKYPQSFRGNIGYDRSCSG